MAEVARGNIVWVDTPDGYVNVRSLSDSFRTFTVSKPKLLVELECGHSFRTGEDDYRRIVTRTWTSDGNRRTEMKGERTTYNCIQCQKPVKISSWGKK